MDSMELAREQGPMELAQAKMDIMGSIKIDETAIKLKRLRVNNQAGANSAGNNNESTTGGTRPIRDSSKVNV